MDLTPTITALNEQIKQLEKIVNELEYQQLLNKALETAKKQKQNGNNNQSKTNEN